MGLVFTKGLCKGILFAVCYFILFCFVSAESCRVSQVSRRDWIPLAMGNSVALTPETLS